MISTVICVWLQAWLCWHLCTYQWTCTIYPLIASINMYVNIWRWNNLNSDGSRFVLNRWLAHVNSDVLQRSPEPCGCHCHEWSDRWFVYWYICVCFLICTSIYVHIFLYVCITTSFRGPPDRSVLIVMNEATGMYSLMIMYIFINECIYIFMHTYMFVWMYIKIHIIYCNRSNYDYLFLIYVFSWYWDYFEGF